MREPGDYSIRLLEVQGTFYNGIQVRADGQARLGHLTKTYNRTYVEVRELEDMPIPRVPVGWERRIVRDLSPTAIHELKPDYQALS